MGHVITTEINYEERTQIFCLVYSQIIYLWFSYEKNSNQLVFSLILCPIIIAMYHSILIKLNIHL